MPIRQAVCVPGARRSMQPAREGEQRTGTRATHHDIRNQAEMGWRPDELQPPLRSWAFERTLGHQGTGAVPLNQGSRVQHCLASASPGRPPLRPVAWGGGGHTPCSRGNSNCVSGALHAPGEKTRVRRVPRSGREPARQSRASPALPPRELHPRPPWVPRGCTLTRREAQGLGRHWQRRGLAFLSGPLSTVQSAWPPLSSSQSSSCPAFQPLPL